jgi:hypothetical protein
MIEAACATSFRTAAKRGPASAPEKSPLPRIAGHRGNAARLPGEFTEVDGDLNLVAVQQLLDALMTIIKGHIVGGWRLLDDGS